MKNGNTLTIQCKVAMATDGKITVEKGAKLIIDGGEVTGWCKTTPAGSNYNLPLWTGIEIDGDPTQNQLINNATGYCANQGIVEVKNGGKISYAYKGINTSRTNSAGGAWISGTSGGIVITSGATFENNVFDIIFYKYQLGNVRSKIESSTFATTGAIGYDGNNALIEPKEHIKLYDNSGLTIKGCVFGCNASGAAVYPVANRGTGLYTTDSHFTVDDLNANAVSVFNNLREGIYIDNGNPIYTATIRNTDFSDNEYGTKVENCNYLAFYGNNLNVPSYGSGVYLFRSKYYNVRNNTFTGSGYTDGCMGLIAYDNKEGLHQVYRNTFSAFNTGIMCYDDNGGYAYSGSGLKMNCNVFNSGSYNLLDIAMMSVYGVPVVMTKQSSNTASSPNDYVKNLYGAPYLLAGFNNKWYVDPSNTQNIIHACTPGGVDNPKVPVVQSDPQVWVSPYNYGSLDYVASCPAWDASSPAPIAPISDQVTALNAYISDLRDLDAEEAAPEIQASVASKLNLFLMDTLPESNDSVVAILQSNQGSMDDADIQLVFAHLRAESYASANTAIAGLADERGDWQAMLEKIYDMKRNADDIYSFFSDAANVSFMSNYADTEDMDGQACAQALLSFIGITHEFPLVYVPFNSDGDRLAKPAKSGQSVKLYPNPAQSGFNLENLPADQGALKIQVLDVLGKVVVSETLSGRSAKHYVSLKDLNEGVYLLRVSNEKENVVYQTKVIKQN